MNVQVHSNSTHNYVINIKNEGKCINEYNIVFNNSVHTIHSTALSLCFLVTVDLCHPPKFLVSAILARICYTLRVLIVKLWMYCTVELLQPLHVHTVLSLNSGRCSRSRSIFLYSS